MNIIPVPLPVPVHGSESVELDSLLKHDLVPALMRAYEKAPNPDHVRALVLTNPHNPLGLCYPAHVLRGCIDFCRKRGIHYVSDEVYAMSEISTADLERGNGFVSALSLAPAQPSLPTSTQTGDQEDVSVHVIWSISKDYGSSGLRMVSLTCRLRSLTPSPHLLLSSAPSH